MHGDPGGPSGHHPRVWLLIGHKTGDNAQVRALADALGWPYQIKQLVYRRTELLTNRLLGPSLAGVRTGHSSPLEPPWPDLVISAGRRNEPAARWIQRQAGHRVRLVHIGRPWARLDLFDLIITTPQYRLPDAPNILHNSLPLHAITEERITEAADLWAQRLAHLPRPYVSLLVGGNSGPFTLDPDLATRLGRQADRLARQLGGSLLVTTSARTPAYAADAIARTIHCPSHLHIWTQGAADNPYQAYLGLGDAHIVTGDSMSMLTEACATHKPVYLFDMREPCRSPAYPSGTPCRPLWKRWRSLRFKALSHRLAMRYGPPRMARDISRIHQHLINTGKASWLGKSITRVETPTPDDDLENARARVLGLFGTHPRHP